MNTFVCEGDFAAAAARLWWRHLGKQRVEVWQMLSALLGLSPGWSHHTALAMWRGHEHALAVFGLACHDQWIGRGYVDTTRGRLAALASTLPDTGMPWWIDDVPYRTACRSWLVEKNPDHYGSLWPDVERGLSYLYPDATRPGEYITPKSRARAA